MTKAQILADSLGKENTQVNEKLFTLDDIPNTPFKILIRENQHTLVFGKYRLTEPMPQKKDILEYLESNKWNIIATLALIIMEKITEGTNQPKDTFKQ